MRTFLIPVFAAASFAALAPSVATAQDASALAQKYNCLTCHAVDAKKIGPSYKDVAAKYKGNTEAAAKLAAKVKAGGSGVWGTIPMPPNAAVPDDDLKKLVGWVLAQ
ncbi:MAG TPA: c-type cytochrome [Burkholderiaceae bacterium]|nr:c-type cytochrome [Burkholderiaceae bacterium]